MSQTRLPDRREVLSGFLDQASVKQASTQLVLIECQTARLVVQARQATQVLPVTSEEDESDLAYLTAFGAVRAARCAVTAQELEQHAPRWAHLVSGSPRTRAAIAHLLGEKYALPAAATPNLRAVLGLDTEAVRQAYRQLYGADLETIYRPALSPFNRVRWAWNALAKRLMNMPPFWTAFALTLTETVGAGILALPIALAGVGPLAGLALIVILGLVNVFTIALIAESLARSGTVRLGGGFIGSVVGDYLGSIGSVVLSMGVLLICVIALIAYLIGFGSTLEDATSLPAELWVLLLFGVQFYFLRRESLGATVASALVVGLTNIVLVLLLSALALPYVKPEYLTYGPFREGFVFDASILRLIFGVLLAAFFGHLSISNCAHTVLQQNGGARALIWGSASGIGVAVLLYGVWTVCVNGAVAPEILGAEAGTALTPLAAVAGPVVHLLGGIFVVLAMGMASIHFSLGLFNLTREWLPAEFRPVILLSRRGQLYFRPHGLHRDRFSAVLSYLGLEDNRARFRVDVQVNGIHHCIERAVTESWDLREMLPTLPRLAFEISVLDRSAESVRVQIASRMAVSYQEKRSAVGLHMADILTLPDLLRQLLNWLVNQGEARLPEIAAHLQVEEQMTQNVLDELTGMGFVRVVWEADGRRYRPNFAARQDRSGATALLDKLDPPSTAPTPGVAPRLEARPWENLLSARGRYWLALIPVTLVFLFTETLLLSESESFSEPLSFLGVVVISLLAGIFPVLLLAASRQKGEFVPETVYRFLANRALLGGVYLVSLTSLFLHALVIWESTGPRLVALATGLFAIGFTYFIWRRGGFAPRAALVLTEKAGERGETSLRFTAVVGGRPAPVTVRLYYADGHEQILHATAGVLPDRASLARAVFELPATTARDVKVWARCVTPEKATGIPAWLTVRHGSEETDWGSLEPVGGPVTVLLRGARTSLTFTFNIEGVHIP
ncbi:MAG: hypothetical protein JXB47_10105 [Anaerolineae bacterium]|nr:hypothetical protein [Anaerolineae bacterium]